jgi:hypothetical protein
MDPISGAAIRMRVRVGNGLAERTGAAIEDICYDESIRRRVSDGDNEKRLMR